MKSTIVLFLYLTCLNIFCAHNVYAQSVIIGLKGGISIPNLTAPASANNPLNTGYSSSLGPDFALYGEYKWKGDFSLELAVEYSSQGGKKNGVQAVPVPPVLVPEFPTGQVPPYLWANFDGEAKLNYLLIPVLAKYSFKISQGSPFHFYVEAGPFVGFVMSAKTTTSGSGNVYSDKELMHPLLPQAISFDATTDIKDQLHSANFGIEGNVGFVYGFGRNSIFVEAGGNYGFINIQKDPANGENHTGAATVRLGFSHRMGH